jgi:hypothetical protein
VSEGSEKCLEIDFRNMRSELMSGAQRKKNTMEKIL